MSYLSDEQAAQPQTPAPEPTREDMPARARRTNPTWAEIVESGDLEGYTYGGYNEIDADVSESHPCPDCGGKMEYIPMRSPGSYRAFARCEKCHGTVEF